VCGIPAAISWTSLALAGRSAIPEDYGASLPS
jgi:hypothetical protein